MKLYIRGRPMTITIDDYIPFYNGNLIFEKAAANAPGKSNNMNIWGVLLEKAFAKITGNYEYINYGW
jgi:Calpain family cysteine protease